jgi:hypothetical protein
MTTLHQHGKTVSAPIRRIPRLWLLVGTAMPLFACDFNPFDPTPPPPVVGCNGETLPGETLESYSSKCDQATVFLPNVAVDCDSLTEIPTGPLLIDPNTNGEICDQPNVLRGDCDPFSRFGVIARDFNSNSIAVMLCRKRKDAANNHRPKDSGTYGDIEIIQYNATTGATCFYQALEKRQGEFSTDTDGKPDLPHLVTPPRQGGAGDFPWMSPQVVNGDDDRCVRCHDNGPFIRSPWIAQLRTEMDNFVPGTKDDAFLGTRKNFNQTNPYKFVGNDFQTWKAYEIEAGNTCTNCHRMGLSEKNNTKELGLGTSLQLGKDATASTQSSRTAFSFPNNPIWMPPLGLDPFATGVFNSAEEMKAIDVMTCAKQFAAGNVTMPNCSGTLFAQGDQCLGPSLTPPIPGVFTRTIESPSEFERFHAAVDE